MGSATQWTYVHQQGLRPWPQMCWETRARMSLRTLLCKDNYPPPPHTHEKTYVAGCAWPFFSESNLAATCTWRQCSSWVFINRATSCRTAANPLGDTTKGYVGTGNKQAARCSALALIASWRNLVWTLEQPASSLFHLHPRWQWLLGHLQIWRHGFNMGAYGASSMKPSVLWANVPWV